MRLRFEDGKVVDASASRNEEFLIQTLDTDDGARRLGELGIGTNYGIDRFTKRDPARREDRRHDPHGGRRCPIPRRAATNDSAVHWDMVCDLRQGGRITVDGEDLQVDGRFVV